MISCKTPSPTPTLSASRPSFAAPASSPSATCTRSGSSLTGPSAVPTSTVDTVFIAAVPPVLGGLVRTRHGPNATGRGGRTAASSSTSYGTTSIRAADRLRRTEPAVAALEDLSAARHHHTGRGL